MVMNPSDLNAQIDIRKNTLKIGRKTFQMLKRFPDNQTININENEFQYIALKTRNDYDFLIADELNPNSFTILPGLYRSINNRAVVEIQNSSTCPQEINSNDVEMENDPYDSSCQNKLIQITIPFVTTT